MRRVVLIGTVALLLAACADTHELLRTSSHEALVLDPSDPVYVSVPRDGTYEQQIYHGSGQKTAQIILAAFSQHASQVRSGRKAQSFDEAIAAAKSTGSEHLVFPTILHWEDRATEWSGIPDRVEVKLEVVDVKTTETQASVLVKGKSGLATFGGDRPEDLLSSPVGEFAASLY